MLPRLSHLPDIFLHIADFLDAHALLFLSLTAKDVGSALSPNSCPFFWQRRCRDAFGHLVPVSETSSKFAARRLFNWFSSRIGRLAIFGGGAHIDYLGAERRVQMLRFTRIPDGITDRVQNDNAVASSSAPAAASSSPIMDCGDPSSSSPVAATEPSPNAADTADSAPKSLER